MLSKENMKIWTHCKKKAAKGKNQNRKAEEKERRRETAVHSTADFSGPTIGVRSQWNMEACRMTSFTLQLKIVRKQIKAKPKTLPRGYSYITETGRAGRTGL